MPSIKLLRWRRLLTTLWFSRKCKWSDCSKLVGASFYGLFTIDQFLDTFNIDMRPISFKSCKDHEIVLNTLKAKWFCSVLALLSFIVDLLLQFLSVISIQTKIILSFSNTSLLIDFNLSCKAKVPTVFIPIYRHFFLSSFSHFSYVPISATHIQTFHLYLSFSIWKWWNPSDYGKTSVNQSLPNGTALVGTGFLISLTCWCSISQIGTRLASAGKNMKIAENLLTLNMCVVLNCIKSKASCF